MGTEMYVVDSGDFPWIAIVEHKPGDAYAEVRAVSSSSYELNGPRFWGDPDQQCDDITKATPEIKASIKWDGCSHVWFGEKGDSGYMHLCGSGCWRTVARVLPMMRDLAIDTMRRSGEDRDCVAYAGHPGEHVPVSVLRRLSGPAR